MITSNIPDRRQLSGRTRAVRMSSGRMAGTPAANPPGRDAQGMFAPALLAPIGNVTGDHRDPPMGSERAVVVGPFGPRGIGILVVLPRGRVLSRGDIAAAITGAA